MNCRECQDLLQSCLDERRMAAPRHAQEHLRECDACRGNFAAASSLLAGLAQLAVPEPPATMSANVAARVLADRRARRRMAAFRWYATAGLAACVLVLVAFGWLTPRTPVPVIVQHETNKVEPKPAPKESPLAQRADEAQKAMASLTRSVGETTKSRLKVFLPESTRIEDVIPPFPDMDESREAAFDPAAQSLKQAGMSVAQTFEPVAQTAVRAFDFFAREMPTLDFSKN